MVDWILALALLVATALMSYGCWLASRPAGFIVGGFLLAVLAVLFFLETD